jgi:hypothetical protein
MSTRKGDLGMAEGRQKAAGTTARKRQKTWKNVEKYRKKAA